jgi:hypothetical protein
MKKKTYNKLSFNKAAVTELSDNQYQDIAGGSLRDFLISYIVTHGYATWLDVV